MDPTGKSRLRPFKRNFFRTLEWNDNGCRFAATLLDEFERHWEIYPKRWGDDPLTLAPAHRWMSFQLAIPRRLALQLAASPSPASVDHASQRTQLGKLFAGEK